MDIEASRSALTAYALRQQTAAHNVANLSTPGYSPYRVELQEVEDHEGVQGEVVRLSQDGSGVQARGEQAGGSTDTSSEQSDSAAESPSRTDLAVEFTTMIENETAYSANAAVIRTSQQMTGEVLNLLA